MFVNLVLLGRYIMVEKQCVARPPTSVNAENATTSTSCLFGSCQKHDVIHRSPCLGADFPVRSVGWPNELVFFDRNWWYHIPQSLKIHSMVFAHRDVCGPSFSHFAPPPTRRVRNSFSRGHDTVIWCKGFWCKAIWWDWSPYLA